jgi:hypothetical protein
LPSGCPLRRVIVGHHDVDDSAVLAAVQASVLRTDRVCAQRTGGWPAGIF